MRPHVVGEEVGQLDARLGIASSPALVPIHHRRVERLDADARTVLRAASVLGGVFWRGALSALVGDSAAAQLDGVLARLIDEEVIAEHAPSRFGGEREYAFRHALVREAAYAMLTDRDRPIGHRIAGRWLERAGESDPNVLAAHFDRGGEPARAARYYLRAAQQALEGNDLAAGLAIAERGLACKPEAEILGRLRMVQARAHIWRGDYRSGAAQGEEALKVLSEEDDAWASAAAEVVRALQHRFGDYDRVAELGLRLARLVARGHGGIESVLAAARAAEQLFLVGRTEPAESVLAVIETVAANHIEQSPLVRARVQAARSTRALVEGDTGAYLDLYERAVTGFELAGDAHVVCTAGVNIGYGFLVIGEHERAEKRLRGALREAERLGLDGVAAYARQNLGLALARMGQIREAIEVESLALEAFRTQRDERGATASHLYLTEAHMLAGDQEGAADRESRAALNCAGQDRPLRANALAMMARVLLHASKCKGDAAATAARDAAQEAMDILTSLDGIEEGDALVRLSYAETLLHTGDETGALDAAVQARAHLLERAAKISDPRLRESFLQRVPDHARTLSLADDLEAAHL